MAAGKRHSLTHAYPHTNTCSYSNAHASSDTAAFRWRHLRGRMEFHPGLLQYFYNQLQRRQQGQQEWLELYGTVLEHESGPNRRRQFRSVRIWRALVHWGCVLHWHSNTHAHSYSNAQADSHADSASARQRDLRRL